MLGSGGKKTFKWYLKSEQTHRQTYTQTHIWTNRLTESIGPKDLFILNIIIFKNSIGLYTDCHAVASLCYALPLNLFSNLNRSKKQTFGQWTWIQNAKYISLGLTLKSCQMCIFPKADAKLFLLNFVYTFSWPFLPNALGNGSFIPLSNLTHFQV